MAELRAEQRSEVENQDYSVFAAPVQQQDRGPLNTTLIIGIKNTASLFDMVPYGVIKEEKKTKLNEEKIAHEEVDEIKSEIYKLSKVGTFCHVL